MDEIMSIARRYNVFVIEDCAQAFGSKWRSEYDAGVHSVGSIGNIGSFSFFPSKNLGGYGDAGAITTNDDELAGLIRILIKHGGKDKYNVDHIGYNARLDTLQAAILLAKLKYIDDFNTRRRQIAQLYAEGLQRIDGLILPIDYCQSPIAQESHVFHQFTLRIRGEKRNSLQTYLKEAGIDSMVYYPVLLSKMNMFAGKSIIYGELSEAEKIVSDVLSLPMEPVSDKEHVLRIITVLKSYFT